MDLLEDLPVFLGASFDCNVGVAPPPLVPLARAEDDSSGTSSSLHTSSDTSKPDDDDVVTKPAARKASGRKNASKAKRSAGEDDDDFCISDAADDEDDDVVVLASSPSTSSGGGGSKKKKSRPEPAHGVDPNASVVLSRDRLLTISSQEYDAFLAAISRPLSEGERAEVRRQRRLIKNRESAALSRNRKRQAMEVLEEENAKLRAELAKMKAKLEQYERSRVVPGALFVVLFSVGLFWGWGAALVPSFASPSTDSGLAFSPESIPNLRKLMSHEPTMDLGGLCTNRDASSSCGGGTSINETFDDFSWSEGPNATMGASFQEKSEAQRV